MKELVDEYSDFGQGSIERSYREKQKTDQAPKSDGDVVVSNVPFCNAITHIYLALGHYWGYWYSWRSDSRHFEIQGHSQPNHLSSTHQGLWSGKGENQQEFDPAWESSFKCTR